MTDAPDTTKQGNEGTGGHMLAAGAIVFLGAAASFSSLVAAKDNEGALLTVVYSSTALFLVLNGLGLALRYSAHGVKRLSRLDGAGKLLSLVGWAIAFIPATITIVHVMPPTTARVVVYGAGGVVLMGSIILMVVGVHLGAVNELNVRIKRWLPRGRS